MIIKKVTTPIGVIGVIYESRPNVTADVAALCLKSGNCSILRGGSEAFNSNRIAKRILGLTDIVGLVEKAQKTFDEESAKKLEQKIIKNEFPTEIGF